MWAGCLSDEVGGVPKEDTMYTDLFALDQAAQRERELAVTLERRRLAAERAPRTATPRRPRHSLIGRWLVAH